MQLYFAVPDTATTHEGVLVRSFLRQCAVSTDLARAVKFRGGGFFADGVPVLASAAVRQGQNLLLSFPEKENTAPAPVELGLPTTVQLSGTSLSTMEPAPIFTLLPMVMGPSTFAPAPMVTLLPMVGWRLPMSLPVPPNVTP